MAGIWLFGLFAALSTIHLTLAWREFPPQDRFENAINRVLLNTFGWLTLSIVFVFAIVIDGVIWPPLAGLAIWGLWRLLRRNVGLERVYWLAAPLGVAALITVLMMFQIVFGDQTFGFMNFLPR